MKHAMVLAAALCLSGCLFESVPQLPKHTKGFGEYWAKEGMTTEQWRADWVDCGGRANGVEGHSGHPSGDTAERMFARLHEARSRLAGCMGAKGYLLQPGPFNADYGPAARLR